VAEFFEDEELTLEDNNLKTRPLTTREIGRLPMSFYKIEKMKSKKHNE
jgi:hypothetical protein